MRKTIKILLIAAGLFIAAAPVISIADDEIMDEGIVGVEEDSGVHKEESAPGSSRTPVFPGRQIGEDKK